ncbi:hypothetical protein KY284_036557 [Solanum tuberosum]|nr:hypothetical protein KY284_036557 [Solanum tuberosum]
MKNGQIKSNMKCGWMLKSSSINKSGMFRIRKFVNEHTCPLKDKVYDQRQATSNLVGGMIQPKLVDHKRKLTPKDIQQDVSLALGVDVSYAVAWKTKEKAVISLKGTSSRSYSKLPSYLYILDTTYPRSYIRMNK